MPSFEAGEKFKRLLNVPEELWNARDSVITFAFNGGDPPDGLKELKKWFSEDYEVWENLHSETAANDFNPHILASKGILARACESELQDSLCIKDGTKSSESIRIQFTRDVLREELETNYSDSDCVFGISHRWISKSDGECCLIGYIEMPGGQAGIECVWQGVFTDEDTWAAHLANEGFLQIADVNDVPDQALLVMFDEEG